MDNGYGGMMIWEASQDTYDDNTSLLKAMNDVLTGPSVPNEQPVAEAQNASTDEDSSVSITLTASDLDGDSLTFSVVANPSNGSLSGTVPNLTYTPTLNFDGTDSFTFKVNDGKEDSDIATVSITVNPINDVPVTADQFISTIEDTPIEITLSATDVDSTLLTYSVEDPLSGELSGTAPHLTYTPNPGFTGDDSFAFFASDGTTNSNSSTVSISVNTIDEIHLENMVGESDNKKRWKATVTFTVFNGTEFPYSGATVSGTWSGDSNQYSCITSEGKCSLSKTTRDNSLVFTVENISGTSVTYNPSANHVDNSITINKDSTPTNYPPTADAGGPYSSSADITVFFDGSSSGDSDGTIVNYAWDYGDGNTGTGVSPNHTYSADGVYSVTLTVTDDYGATDSISTMVTISSQSGGELSVSGISPPSMIKGTTQTVTISGTGFDLDTIVSFGGTKWSPQVVQTISVSPTEIIVDVTRSDAGPNRNFVYDVIVTNSDNNSDSLPGSFTVTYQ
jgi:PKD repeat protein